MDTLATKFLLDSGDPNEYREIADLAKSKGYELWGATTNPSLIAKKLSGKKISQEEAFKLQKEIVLEIVDIVPGAVSAEVYADETTTAEDMIKQGREIARWHKRVVVKIPTTLESFKARTELRKNNIPVNNTLVFSQEQITAICLHEHIIQNQYGPTTDMWPPFISPFVGRLDDIGQNGMDLVKNGMKIKKLFTLPLPKTTLSMWMLEASVRNTYHMEEGITIKTELITAPAKIYRQWFENREKGESNNSTLLQPIEYWTPPQDILAIHTIDEFMEAITSQKFNISHPLTDKGLMLFAKDWQTILTS